MPGPIWPQSYSSWYQGLFRRATAPVREFGKGVAMGAGLPTSGDEIRQGMAQTLGLAFGVPSAYSKLGEDMQSTGEALSRPIETAQSLGSAARANPAGAAGVAMGMALPFGKRPDLKFGGKALRRAERRVDQRILRERARVHADLEGPTGALPDIPTDIAGETVADWMAGMGNARIVKMRDLVPTDLRAAFDKELARRNLKRDISADLQVLHEGQPGGLPRRLLRTAEDIGTEMLYDVPLPHARSAAQVGANQLMQSPQFRRTPLGGTVAAGGSRWMKSTRGWTKLEGKPRGRDFDWVYDEFLGRTRPEEQRMLDAEALGNLDYAPGEAPHLYSSARGSDIQGAIKQIASQGDISEARATVLTAKKISERMRAGRALNEEIVWYNIYQMRGFGKGGMKWGSR